MPEAIVQLENPALRGKEGAAPDPKGAAPASAGTAADPSKTAAASPTSGQESAKGDGAASGAEAKPAEGAKADGDKPPEKPIRTAAAILAEREAKLVEERKAFKAEREAAAAASKAHEAELAAARAILEAARGKGAKMAVIDAAAKAAGLTREQFIEQLQDEYLADGREPTPEERARKIAEDAIAAERKRVADETKAAAEAEAKKVQDAAQAGYARYCSEVEAVAAELGPKFADEFDLCFTLGKTVHDVAMRANEELRAGRPVPSPREALALLEKDLQATLGKSKKFKAAEASPPAAKPEDKKTAPAEDSKPRTLTSRGGADEVPITAKPKERKKTALERLEEAKRELNVS